MYAQTIISLTIKNVAKQIDILDDSVTEVLEVTEVSNGAEVIEIADEVLTSAVTDLDKTLQLDENRVIKKLKLVAAKACENFGGKNTILTICMLCVKNIKKWYNIIFGLGFN